jgi:hypothetical protein
MELVTAVQAGDIVTTFLGFITANIPAVVAVLGTVVGIKWFRSFGNRALRGKM